MLDIDTCARLVHELFLTRSYKKAAKKFILDTGLLKSYCEWLICYCLCEWLICYFSLREAALPFLAVCMGDTFVWAERKRTPKGNGKETGAFVWVGNASVNLSNYSNL